MVAVLLLLTKVCAGELYTGMVASFEGHLSLNPNVYRDAAGGVNFLVQDISVTSEDSFIELTSTAAHSFKWHLKEGDCFYVVTYKTDSKAHRTTSAYNKYQVTKIENNHLTYELVEEDIPVKSVTP